MNQIGGNRLRGSTTTAEFIAIALATFISTFVAGSVLADLLSQSIQDDQRLKSTVFLFQALIFVIAAFSFRYLLLDLKKFRIIRRWLDPRSQFEGLWFELTYADEEFKHGEIKLNLTKQNVPRYAMFEIRYLGPKEDAYWISGTQYFPNAGYYSVWRTGDLIFDIHSKKIVYLFDAHRTGKHGQVSGFASLTFRRGMTGVKDATIKGLRRVNHRKTKLHSGVGYVVEDGETTKRTSLEFLRVTSDEVAAIIPEFRNMHGGEITRSFLREYHKKFAHELQNGIIDPMNGCDEEALKKILVEGRPSFLEQIRFDFRLLPYIGMFLAVLACLLYLPKLTL